MEREERTRLQKENQGLQEETQGLREGNQELQERVMILIERLDGNEKVITELREELQRLQGTNNEEIHSLRERVSELEVAYLGGCGDY